MVFEINLCILFLSTPDAISEMKWSLLFSSEIKIKGKNLKCSVVKSILGFKLMDAWLPKEMLRNQAGGYNGKKDLAFWVEWFYSSAKLELKILY
jgi:hypothetical protein